jgi:hypothetical protein
MLGGLRAKMPQHCSGRAVLAGDGQNNGPYDPDVSQAIRGEAAHESVSRNLVES